MGLSAEVKHLVHVMGFVSWLLLFEIIYGGIQWHPTEKQEIDPVARYGWLGASILYFVRLATLLILPQSVCNTLGLLLFNGFKEKVELKESPLLAPFISIRVVTKGDYPELVRQNVARNIQTCHNAGMENFIFEVVTDIRIEMLKNPRVREVVVPDSYRTRTGALFKARALQYCLEDYVNILRDDDWIVHLDEETLLTENSVRGVLNFCWDGKHQFGQGVITYANGEIVNWLTTLCDSFRVADDLGKLRFQFSYFHRPLFGWKGSYVVTQLGAERKVTYDHGMDGSIAEDCYFSMIAFRDGYSFDFIEGEMHEKSPFTFWDFLQQRKRWLQGTFLTVHSREIPIKNKLLLALSLYAWVTMPLTTLQLVLSPWLPLPRYVLFDFLIVYLGAVNLYMYLFGAIKAFSNKYKQQPWRLVLYTVGAVLTIPFNILIDSLAVLWGMIGQKHQFYVVKKDRQVLDI